MVFYTIIFLSSLLGGLCVRYISIKNAFFIDDHTHNKPQRFHTIAVPRSGGIAIFISSLFMVTLPYGEVFWLAGSLAFMGGIFEDFHGTLSPKKRLLFQMGSAFVFMLITGVYVTHLSFGPLPFLISAIFTLFAIVGGINAINIIDGFNGLAGSIIMMILFAFGIAAWSVGDRVIVDLCIVLFCATLGFMVLNFPYGKIFLGDGGAYFLGFSVAQIGVMLHFRHPDISPWFILAILIYPVWEVLFSFYRKKIVRGISPMEPDKVHFHMLIFKRLTRSNPLTSLVIAGGVFPFIIGAILFRYNTFALIMLIGIFVLSYGIIYKRFIRFRGALKH